jgi:hypothetical protein
MSFLPIDGAFSKSPIKVGNDVKVINTILLNFGYFQGKGILIVDVNVVHFSKRREYFYKFHYYPKYL